MGTKKPTELPKTDDSNAVQEKVKSGIITDQKCQCALRDNYNECRKARKIELITEETKRRQDDRNEIKLIIDKGITRIIEFAENYVSDNGQPQPKAIDLNTALPQILVEPPNSLIEQKLDTETFELCAAAFNKTMPTDLYEQHAETIRTIDVLGARLELSPEVVKREPNQIVEKIECKNDWLNYWLSQINERIEPLRKFSPKLRDAVTHNSTYVECEVEQNFDEH